MKIHSFPRKNTLGALLAASVILLGVASSQAEMLLGTVHFNSPVGFTQSWTSVQFSISDSGLTLFSTSSYYNVGQSATLSLTSGAAFELFSANLTDADNGAMSLFEKFKNGTNTLGGVFQDYTERGAIVKTSYGNNYSFLPDFSGYSISRLELTIADITRTYVSPNYVAGYNTNFNVYGTLLTPVPEAGQVTASLLAMLGLGVVVVRKRNR